MDEGTTTSTSTVPSEIVQMMSSRKITTLRIKPFNNTLKQVQEDIEKVAHIVTKKECIDKFGARVVDVEFATRDEAEYVLQHYNNAGGYNMIWAPANLTDSYHQEIKTPTLGYRLTEKDEEPSP